MRVRPAPGQKVRDPVSKQHIPAEGAEVPESSYWVRRLMDGSVLPVDAEPAPALHVNSPIPDSTPAKDEA